MGNLSLTLDNLSITLKVYGLESNSICFVTTSGVYFGSIVFLKEEITEIENPDDVLLMAYSRANRFTKEDFEKEENSYLKEIDLKETILLENVKYKIGKAIINSEYVVLNKNQIVSVTLFPNTNVDELLEQY